MKLQWEPWEKWSAKIDALSLRERAILFIVSAIAIVFLVNHFLIEPQFARQKKLSDNMKQDQVQMSALLAEIGQRSASKNVDPDAENKQKLLRAQQTLKAIEDSLQSLQKNLVRPEKMAGLLDGILRRNRSLQLVSLKSQPVVSVTDVMNDPVGKPVTGAALAGAVAKPAAGTNVSQSGAAALNGNIYKHEVEIVLQGNYLDMLAYLRELESLPEQVYWSSAQMNVDTYPKATLTLNLFTLSLDKKWLDL
ncbi:N/A [soil metagenome]